MKKYAVNKKTYEYFLNEFAIIAENSEEIEKFAKELKEHLSKKKFLTESDIRNIHKIILKEEILKENAYIDAYKKKGVSGVAKQGSYDAAQAAKKAKEMADAAAKKAKDASMAVAKDARGGITGAKQTAKTYMDVAKSSGIAGVTKQAKYDASQLAKQAKEVAKGDFSNVSPGAKVAGGVVAGAAAAGAGVAAYKIISNVLKHYRWKKQGCDKILDSARQAQCKTYLTKQEINALTREMNKCKDDSCKSKVSERISKLQSKLV